MLDPGATNESTTVQVGEAVNGHAHGEVAPLEQRVRQLEDAVAQLQDTDELEERVATRVTERMSRNVPVAVAQPAESGGVFSRLPRALLPLSVTTIDPARPSPAGPGTQPVGWRALLDLLPEFRTFWRMYVDPRYRLTWLARIVAPVLFIAILLSWWWLPFALALQTLSGIVATLYVKAADLALAFFLYKALSREARRYRDAFPDATSAPPAVNPR